MVRPKLEYVAPIWTHIVKTQQVEKVQRTAASSIAGGGATLVVLARCSMNYNGQLWRPGDINSLCFSSTRFILGLCLLIKTST